MRNYGRFKNQTARFRYPANASQTRYGIWSLAARSLCSEKMRVMRAADTVIADPLYKVVLRGGDQTEFVPFPHEAYSGRIFRSSIPEFAGEDFDPALLLKRRLN